MIGVLRVEGGGKQKEGATSGYSHAVLSPPLCHNFSIAVVFADKWNLKQRVKTQVKTGVKKKQMLLARSELMLRRRRQTEYLSARWEETVGCYCRWPATWLHLSPLPAVRIKGRSGRRLWSEHFTMSARDISAVKCLFHNDGHPRLSTAFNRLTSHLLFVSPFCL